jgi:hypothetical protein
MMVPIVASVMMVVVVAAVTSVVVSAVGVVMVMVCIVVVVSRIRPIVFLGLLFMRVAWVIVVVMLVSFVVVVGSRGFLAVVMELSAQVLVIFSLHKREHEAEQ